MTLYFPMYGLPFGDLLDTILPDFVLAFAFFTSIIYAVLGRHFGVQRPAVVMSAAIGLALSVGLVWWEQVNGFSIKDLGPLAAGFAIIILAGVLYQAIRQVGGNWAGAAIAFGACILIGWTLGIDWPVRAQIVQTVTTVALVLGVLAFIGHRHGQLGNFIASRAHLPEVRHDMRDLYQDHRVANRVARGFRHLRKEADHLHEHPEDAGDVMLQLQRMLPAEGWLTQRMARLREKAHIIRRGHAVAIEEVQQQIGKLPGKARQKAARELTVRYKELEIDRRVERLDNAVAEIEKRIRDLTRQAQSYLQSHDYRRLSGVLEAASKLQRHNARLIKEIERTESRLMAAARKVAQQPSEVSHA